MGEKDSAAGPDRIVPVAIESPSMGYTALNDQPEATVRLLERAQPPVWAAWPGYDKITLYWKIEQICNA